MSRRPHRTARLAVDVVKGGVVTLIAMIACGLGATPSSVGATAAPGDPEAALLSAQQTVVDRLMAKHQCSTTGFGPDVIPGSALVLRDNKVRHVSFDDGWAVYTGDAPGTLLALCKVNV